MPESIRKNLQARDALKAIVLLALWGLLTHGTYAGSGDEPHYLAIAHSLAFDRDFDLADNYGADEPLIGGGVLAAESHVRPGTGGVARPVHDVGLPLVFAPYVAVAAPAARLISRMTPPALMQRARLNTGLLYRHLISLAMVALTTLLAGWMFDTFRELGASRGSALATTALLVLSPPLLIFSILFFTELLSALLCFLVFRRACLSDTRGTPAWTLLGLATGFLFLLHAKNIGLVVPLAALALASLGAADRRREALAFTLATLAMIALRTAINYAFWGSWISGPHARWSGWPGSTELIREPAVRLAGLLVDQEFGLLPYGPIYVLAAIGIVSLWRVRRDLAAALALVVVFYVGLIVCPLTNVHGWMGGWNPAARFLTPIVPLLGILVYAGLRATRGVVATLVVAVQVVISAYAWQHPKILWNDGNGRAAFCEITGSRVCALLPSLVPRGQSQPLGR
jgi:hypothetical protein